MLFQSSMSYDVSKGLSFFGGSVVSFFLNRLWTFGQNHSTLRQSFRFSFLYMTTFLTNVLANNIILKALPEYVIFAFFVATGISTVLNFLGSKFWVFTDEIKKN
jgi:putative flippase GtrA